MSIINNQSEDNSGKELQLIEAATSPFSPGEALTIVLKHFDLGDNFTQCLAKEDTTDMELGRGIAGMMMLEDLANFGLGDIILELEKRSYNNAIPQICSLLNREDSYQNLSKCKRTAERTPVHLRGKPNLSFTHYAEICNAKKGSVNIEELINKASFERWTISQLREEIQIAQNKPQKEKSIKLKDKRFLCIPTGDPLSSYTTDKEPENQDDLCVIRLDTLDYACQWESKGDHFVHSWCPIPHVTAEIAPKEESELVYE